MKHLLTLFGCLFAALTLCAADNKRNFAPEEFFSGHLQGIAADESGIYWSCYDCIIKTSWQGEKLLRVPSPKHAGDCAVNAGKLYVSTNLRTSEEIKANQNCTGALLIYDCNTLKLLQKTVLKETPRPDGIVWYKEHLYIANDDFGHAPHPECSVGIYDKDLKFLKKVKFQTGVKMHYGIQTLNLYDGKILGGFYSKPGSFLLEPETFKVLDTFPFGVSVGFSAVPESVFGKPGIICIGRLAGKKGKWFAQADFYILKDGNFEPFSLPPPVQKKKNK